MEVGINDTFLGGGKQHFDEDKPVIEQTTTRTFEDEVISTPTSPSSYSEPVEVIVARVLFALLVSTSLVLNLLLLLAVIR